MKPRRSILAASLLALALLVAGYAWMSRRTGPAAGGGTAASAGPPARGAHRAAAGAAAAPVHTLGGRSETVGSSEVGAFEGEVRSVASGRAVGDAQITLVGPTGALSARSDSAGHFTLSPPTEGIYEITLVQAEGYAPFSLDLGEAPIELRAVKGASLRGITLWLSPIRRYVVRVVDDHDHPVPGARVMRSHPDHALADGALLTTDDLGEARFAADEGTLIEAEHPDYGVGHARVDVAAEISRALTIVLHQAPPGGVPSVRITGHVEDAAGTRVPDVLVTATTELNPASPAAQENLGGRVQTDSRGEFEIKVTPGPYRVVAEDGRLAPARANVDAKSPEPPPITLVLANAATLRGAVTDERGHPVASFSVIVARAAGIARESVAVRTFVDGSGRYEVGALPAGPHVVTVVAARAAPSEERAVTLVSGATTDADFVLRDGGRLTGVVRDAKTKQPIAEANVALEGYQGAGAGTSSVPLAAVAYTDATGHFLLEGLGPGAHSVLVSAPDHHARVVGGLVVRDATPLGPIDVSLRPTEKGEDPRIELVGIGAALSAKDDALVIGKVMPGGGAAEVGLAEGDRILRIDGEPASALGFAGAIQKIRGPEGTTVALVVAKSGGGPEVSLVVPRRSVTN